MSPEEWRKEAAIGRADLELSGHSGPLPPPEFLAQYEQIVSGSAERLLTMAEQQAAHRRQIELAAVKSTATVQLLGLVSAFMIAITAISSGIFLSLRGASGAGLALIVGALAALVAVFIYGKANQRIDLRLKAEHASQDSSTSGSKSR